VEGLFRSIYKGKKVLVTGHTGFKGSWLCLWLKMMGAEIIGYSLAPYTTPNHFDTIGLDINSHIGDIRDRAKFTELIHHTNPDVIFHLAAQPLVKYSYENPLETYESNLIGSLNMLEAARGASNVKAIVCITTDKVYKNFEKSEGYKEEERLGGYDPYSSSKACVELLVDSYRDSFFNTDKFGTHHNTLIASARAGNVIGGGDWSEDRLVPDIIKASIKDDAVHIRNPKGVRPWQHVLEPLFGYLTLGEKLLSGDKKFSGAWNFGPKIKRLMDNTSLANESKKHWDKIQIELGDGDGFHETGLLMVDSVKAMSELSWEPVWSYEEAIKQTILWYKSYYENQVLISEEQIKKYVSEI
jgi:CDP-glucose 4,6-dehydratase